MIEHKLPDELTEDLRTVMQYVVYNIRQTFMAEMQMDGHDPTPILDGTIGYNIGFFVGQSEDGWDIVSMGYVGVVRPDVEIPRPYDIDGDE